MSCEQIPCIHEPLETRLRRSIVKTDTGCLALALNLLPAGHCNAIDCDNTANSFRMLLEQVVMADHINVATIPGGTADVVDCNNKDISLLNLFMQAFGKSDEGCLVIKVSDEFSDSGCNAPCDPLMSIQEKLKRTLVKVDDCVGILVAQSASGLVPFDCDELQLSGNETLLHRLLVPVSADHFAFRFSDQSGLADRCYVFEFDQQDINEDIKGFIYKGGTQAVPLMGSIDLQDTVLNIIAAMTGAGWFDVASGVTFDLITGEKIPLGGGLNHFSFTFKNPKLNGSAVDIGIISTGIQNIVSTPTDCS